MTTSPVQPKNEGEDYPIGFDETPPWDIDSSTKSGDKSSALVPYKKGWAMWNKYRGKARYVWNTRLKLWLPNSKTA